MKRLSNVEQVNLIRRSVKEWNQWRDENRQFGANLQGADLSELDLREADLSRIYLGDINLRNTDLRGVNLLGSAFGNGDFRGADLRDVDFLQFVNSLWLGAVRPDFRDANLTGASLARSRLHHAKLSGAKLYGADLRSVDLTNLDLRKTDLRNANLWRTQALGTDFTGANLTGAYLANWNTNSETKLEGVICDYFYPKYDHVHDRVDRQERRPREGTFKPGEFAALFQKALDTVDLIFQDGIDWQAFFQSFQDLRSQYSDQNLSIQAIEKKQGNAFIVRLEVSDNADKAVIETHAKELYAAKVKILEAQYEERLRLQGRHLEDARQTIEAERRDKATLMAIMTTMANNQQGPKYVINNSQFGGGVADIVQGNQTGGTVNNQNS